MGLGLSKEQTKIVFMAVAGVSLALMAKAAMPHVQKATRPANWNPCHIEYQVERGSETCLALMEYFN